MRQRRLLEFMKDYDVKIQHHPGKSNVITDALSRKTTQSLAYFITDNESLIGDLEKIDLELVPHMSNGFLANIVMEPMIVNEIRAQMKKKIIMEARNLRFAAYPGNTKMYHDLKEHYRWTGMKRDLASHVSKCFQCQRVKEEH
ncbi:uncharacterized protein LOC114273021 [Camellia sinensis]|uniref:uncharacterized protein LOC114273021 n=1 Tax=Camellia sinensis TaxID=4442 RepID=UPI0010363A0E|nr:uncharacterized protein LOC114273021 [Camellia sinensis]